MSRTAPNSPIQRLDFDLLWYIVSMNADMFNDKRALETTLATSRVCPWVAYFHALYAVHLGAPYRS